MTAWHDLSAIWRAWCHRIGAEPSAAPSGPRTLASLAPRVPGEPEPRIVYAEPTLAERNPETCAHMNLPSAQ
jgi:hypothetical protein